MESRNKPKIGSIHKKPRGWAKKLIEVYGLQAVHDTGYECGIHRSGNHFGVSPGVIHYLAIQHQGKRPASKASAVLKGVQAGKVPASYYRTLDFSEEITTKKTGQDDE